jgi:hypothetical protein
VAIDATVAGAASDSYLTLSEAALLAGDDLGPQADGWLAAADPLREKALKRATREIDAFVNLPSARYSTTQALLFPRDIDITGTPLVAILPRVLKIATYEQAAYLLANAKHLDEAASRRAHGLFSYSNPDGTGGSVALDPSFGRLSPDVEALLLRSFRLRGRTGSMRIRSSLDPAPTARW